MDRLLEQRRSNPISGDQSDPRAIAAAQLLAQSIDLLGTQLSAAQVNTVILELLAVVEGDGALFLDLVKTRFVSQRLYARGADVPAVAGEMRLAFAAIETWSATTVRDYRVTQYGAPAEVEQVSRARMDSALANSGAGVVPFLAAMSASTDQPARLVTARLAEEHAASIPHGDQRLREVLRSFAASVRPAEVTSAITIAVHIERARREALGIATMIWPDGAPEAA